MSELLEGRVLLTASASTSPTELFSPAQAVFVQNVGQWSDSSIQYAYSGHGINIGFTQSGAVLDLVRAKTAAPVTPDLLSHAPQSEDLASTRLNISFNGARSISPKGVDRSPASFSYLGPTRDRGDDHEAHGYNKVSFTNLYSGINLLSWGTAGGLTYEFHVAPGADYHQIQVHFSGSDGLSIAPDGSLHVATPLGDVTEAAPVLYQMVKGMRVAVRGQFALVDSSTYTFQITSRYDHSRELIIDPNLTWATFLGGSGVDAAQDVATDAAGNVYVAGSTDSPDWSISGSYKGSSDIYVAKLSSTGSLIYATYLGGSGLDAATGIAVDSAGNAYLTGYTAGGWATPGAYRTTFAGGGFDAFVAKLNPAGTSLVYATYLGGTGADLAYDIAIDPAGDAFVAGYTQSAGWATAGVYDNSYNGSADAFVAKVNPSGNGLLYATYFGGSGDDYGNSIAIDASGNAFIAGETTSSGLATAGAYQSGNAGGSDAFVARFAASGASLTYATYFGGTAFDSARGIAIDTQGNAYIAGSTQSDGIATGAAFNTVRKGIDGFVAKLNPTGSTVIYASYLGGSGDEIAFGIVVDAAGSALVVGYTTVNDWEPSNSISNPFGGKSDAFIANISDNGAFLQNAIYVGGNDTDIGLAITLNSNGTIYIGGATASRNLATSDAYDSGYNGGTQDGFVAKISGLAQLYTGDTNGDSKSNFSDLKAVAQHYGATSGALRSDGDLNGDGRVDFADLVIVAQHYANSAATATIPAAPPFSRRPIRPSEE